MLGSRLYNDASRKPQKTVGRMAGQCPMNTSQPRQSRQPVSNCLVLDQVRLGHPRGHLVRAHPPPEHVLQEQEGLQKEGLGHEGVPPGAQGTSRTCAQWLVAGRGPVRRPRSHCTGLTSVVSTATWESKPLATTSLRRPLGGDAQSHVRGDARPGLATDTRRSTRSDGRQARPVRPRSGTASTTCCHPRRAGAGLARCLHKPVRVVGHPGIDPRRHHHADRA